MGPESPDDALFKGPAMTNAGTPQVLIVGAGPTGLVLAVALSRQNIPFRLIDRNSDPGLASRAMVVQARTLEFYRQLGIADEVIHRGLKVEAIHLREHGKERAVIPFHEMGTGLSPYPFALCFAQDEHERFLVEVLQARGHEIEWNTSLLSLNPQTDFVEAELSNNGTTETVRVPWLCGCDGAHSIVRSRISSGFPGGTYEQSFYVADVKISGAHSQDLFINVAERNLMMMLPVRRTGMQRFIGTLPAELTNRENVAFDSIRGLAESMMGVHIDEVNWFSTYKVHHRVAERFRSGRVFIAGDAGHIHSPAGGQGMNTGIGDAVNLAWKLADVIHGRASDSILDTYDTERIGFARTLVQTTDRVFRAMVSRKPFSRLFRTWILPTVIPAAAHFSLTRRLLFNIISQIRIHYPESDLSKGRVGSIRAGDRLPWVPFDATDNYEHLDGISWRVHVYGAVEQPFRECVARCNLPLDIYPRTSATLHAGLDEQAAWLVRPDGHIALAMASQDLHELHRYLTARQLRFVS